MKIGGFQPLTLSDYPRHLAAIVFTQGCNFRCPFCHNGALLATAPPGETVTDDCTVLKTLQARREFLDGVVITGGEPTLQGDIAEFAGRIRQEQLKVKLDTNGSRPDVLGELLNRHLLDYVAMDVKAPFHKYARLAGVDVSTEAIAESIALLTASDTPCEFRTTFVPALLTENDLEDIRSYLPPEVKYTVQPFVADSALNESLRSTTSWTAGAEAPPSMSPGDGTDNLPHHIDLLSGE